MKKYLYWDKPKSLNKFMILDNSENVDRTCKKATKTL